MQHLYDNLIEKKKIDIIVSVITVVNWLIKKKRKSVFTKSYTNIAIIFVKEIIWYTVSAVYVANIWLKKIKWLFQDVRGVPRTTYFYSHLGFMQNPRSSTGYFQQLIKSNILGSTQPCIYIYKYNIVYRLPPESRNRFRRRLQLFPPHVIPVYYTPCITLVLQYIYKIQLGI